jgi:hypothetical protein
MEGRGKREDMFKFTSVLSKLFIICLLLVFMVSSMGCGSDSALSFEEQARQALDDGYKFLIQGLHTEALEMVNRSIEIYPTQEALLLKPQIEYLKGEKNAAYNSLSEFAKLYPSDGEDDFINAIFLSLEKGNPQEILDSLIIAHNDNFVEMEKGFWWEFIENEPSFSHFRAQPEYEILLKLKDGDDSVITGSIRNVTKFKTKWWGVQIYIKQADLVLLKSKEDLAAMLDKLSAAINIAEAYIIAVALIAVKTAILAKDKGYGVVINWHWWNFAGDYTSFWITSQ